MFIGHFAAALLAKRATPSTSLGVLFVAAQWLDLLWPALLLAGIERADVAPSPDAVIPLRFSHYPFSHSLVAVMGWAVLLGALYGWWSRSLRASLVVAALVVSHWLLDFIVHVPDLPLFLDGGPHLGLGLWAWPVAALALELSLFAAAVVVYLHTRGGHGSRRGAFYGLCAFLVVIQLTNTFGPPPPGIAAVAWSGMATWLLVLWGWWVDRPLRTRRSGRGGDSAPA
jgi:membrane-bound metal-dependent hydrolase YbcI (DUF457 family)